MKAIYLEFSFLKRRSELVITAPTEAVADNIGGITIYCASSIDGCVKNNKQRVVKSLWQNRIMLIVDEINMVFLKLLSMVDSQLS